MADPLVSIVIPVYNVEKYLERCLDSIVAQVYRPIEVIVVNDGSPDGCGDIIRRYEAKWPFIQSIWQENSGLSAARNAGIAKATGKYLALVDSDDYIEADFISDMVYHAEKNNADVVVCNFYFDFPNGIILPFPLMTLQKNMTGEEAAKASLRLYTVPIFAWNKLYRLDLFTKHDIYFPPILYEDVASASRVFVNAENVIITQKPYYHYCLRRTGITGNFGERNITNYLKAVDIIRNFIWDEQLWDDWKRPYNHFLRTVKAQLYLEISFQKNSIPFMKRHRMLRYVNKRLHYLSYPPKHHRNIRHKIMADAMP